MAPPAKVVLLVVGVSPGVGTTTLLSLLESISEKEKSLGWTRIMPTPGQTEPNQHLTLPMQERTLFSLSDRVSFDALTEACKEFKPTYIIANMNDKVAERTVTEDEARKLAQEIGASFFEITALKETAELRSFYDVAAAQVAQLQKAETAGYVQSRKLEVRTPPKSVKNDGGKFRLASSSGKKRPSK